ncbi:vascular endothelial growth factor A-like [Sitophilus oryzae]|uniref:Vascular endothelial growth factor A-like n=1 Tax=Sitophilus oryzae TaxID=7048 RepID=A0A6J2YUE9_SITOR|nr:vascular endothelial growth factor A-like [Sitophilus oryzae]
MWLVKCFCVVLVLVKCSNSEDDGHGHDRPLYTSGQRNSGYGFYPNDFFLHKDVGPGGNFHSHDHHHHDFSHHNHGPLNFNHRYYSQEDAFEGNTNSIPLDFAKTLNEYNVSDLLLHYVDNLPEAQPQIANRFADDGAEESNVERTSTQLARPAKCMPELKTVKIIKSNDSNIFYVPECTRIERCGGCCSHVLLSCQPVETETVSLSVMKTEYTGNNKLKYVGKELVLVEKHTKCRCNCKVKAEDCNSYQEYIEPECRCSCKNIDEEKKCYKRDSRKLWNPELCACQCRDVTPCSTGFLYDYNECRCVQSQVKRRYVINENRKEQPDPI